MAEHDEDDEPRDELLGTVIGAKYELVRKLGEGGMGAVYVGKHIDLDVRYAIKVLRLEGGVRNAEAVRRFKKEAKLGAWLRKEKKVSGLIEHYDFDTLPDGTPYIVMEYLQGETLDDRIAGAGALGVEQAFRFIRAASGTILHYE